jgi:hypothetical protein
VPIRNGTHPWYRFEDITLKGVHPGDDVGVVVTVKPPADPGQYDLILADPQTGQPYMTVPVLFERPGEPLEAEAPAGGAQWGGQAEEPASSGTEDCH